MSVAILPTPLRQRRSPLHVICRGTPAPRGWRRNPACWSGIGGRLPTDSPAGWARRWPVPGPDGGPWRWPLAGISDQTPRRASAAVSRWPQPQTRRCPQAPMHWPPAAFRTPDQLADRVPGLVAGRATGLTATATAARYEAARLVCRTTATLTPPRSRSIAQAERP